MTAAFVDATFAPVDLARWRTGLVATDSRDAATGTDRAGASSLRVGTGSDTALANAALVGAFVIADGSTATGTAGSKAVSGGSTNTTNWRLKREGHAADTVTLTIGS
ncbi:MAG: hypothetical protein QFE16_05750 [Pseudomonadota bacterium]|nr:hypothetical protein [Pseudomonadota bacterium]